MLVLFTDYGATDPYVGQVKAVLTQHAPGVAIIDLLHEAPAYNAHAGAHLLAALATAFPAGSVFLAVVDPGVGTPRETLVAEADGRWFVGPDNGLLSIVAARADERRFWRITWRPQRLSDSFHGRDLFAPVAAWLARGPFPADKLEPIPAPQVQFDAADLPRIIYIDHYGNAWTGIRGELTTRGVVEVKGQRLPYRRIFAEARKGEAFWYVNSRGLIEIAVNRGSAASSLGLAVGDMVHVACAAQSLH
ncbi:MAG: SAM-dependent chlorinase/fluorinase [Thiobacillaceae bacterium]|nr:SAM-dependent chlorinase/fluorinase [Thiobacillaceae bacterium]